MAVNVNYIYSLTYFCAILCQNLINGEVAQLNGAVIPGWTDWKICNPSSRPGCHRYRERTCGNQLGFECTASRDSLFEVFEQQLKTGCNLNNNADDITTSCILNSPNEQPCLGHCYDGIQEVQNDCIEESEHCVLSQYRRCYNESNCLGAWSNWTPFIGCSASCGGGTQGEIRSCYESDGTVVSYNCPGTNVFFTSQNRVSNIPCNTQACLSWSDWVPVPGEDCNATCGEGARRFVSACREGSRGNVSILCNGSDSSGRRFESRPCIDLPPCQTTTGTATYQLDRDTELSPTTATNHTNATTGEVSLLITVVVTAVVFGLSVFLVMLYCCYMKKRRKMNLPRNMALSDNSSSCTSRDTAATNQNDLSNHRNVCSAEAAQQQPTTSQQNNNPAEAHYAPPNIQLDDIFPYATSRNLGTSENENDRRISIASNAGAYETLDSKVTYLALDNAVEGNTNYENAPPGNAEKKEQEKQETVYLKPFN